MTTTIRLTMAQALIRFLDQQYIEIDNREMKFIHGVMGIFGHGNVTGIGEALERAPGNLKFIQGKNEQGMAHAAMAFAKQNNRLGIFACTSSIGPGALNMVTAAATATVNRIPVLFLPGDIFSTRQPDPVLQQVENPSDYTISANDAFKPVSRFWDRIARPEQLMTSLLHAMRVLTDPADTGAVTLSLPQDVQCEAYDYPVSFFDKRVHYMDRRPMAESSRKRSVELIARKKNPIIIAGGGVHYSLAIEQLREFAEAFRIPVGETQAGKSALAWDHPLNMGAIGTTGTLAANRLAKDADLVICVGTRMSDFTTASKSLFQHPEVEFLQLNMNGLDAAKMSQVSVQADAKLALRQLTIDLQSMGYASGYDSDQLAHAKSDWVREADRLYSMEREDGLAQTRVLGEINAFLQPEDVIIGAAGSMPGDLHRLWRTTRPNTYHMEYGFSCMGYEVAGAFGVKLADPHREVYAMVGDGSYLMLHSELVTSLQEGRKITVLLLDNHGFQCIHNLQRENGSDGFGNEFRYFSPEQGGLSGSYMDFDFAANARSLGAKAYTAQTIEQLKQALEAARNEVTTTLIHVKVVPGTNSSGYESWWRVDVAEVSESAKVNEAYRNFQHKLEAVK
ncbi:3D-(3,5/4)-trihydroxycyclohexane-1,2-dione acylhydrolase (decyclizing) [Cohnella silvisoli]|uniref:3D-(3,5/4)-trihydroxycyclohexane-1,2-dione acylhydrolase (Decyclizing) n=1 Tax=Cohnella silvisoli TaxID=2873699 RepID=A0ABV1KTV8_9BACL|nr:3D-(3,5/4)-trihydroxycyclohexane-1,2-dione acylhydrolase (decyclizing) [Cohnella silvisoli]MCD9022852.1 3D-(3,5/4)-trihydroxycyclohexane-1,2-dione acylhydrolase (decyclizing) [Cohnella silvisoli]